MRLADMTVVLLSNVEASGREMKPSAKKLQFSQNENGTKASASGHSLGIDYS